jgi:hypothetical protein
MSESVIENLGGFGGLCAPVNSGVRLLPLRLHMLSRKTRTILACASLVILCGAISVAQEQKKLPCGEPPDLLRDEKGKVVWLKWKELNERATHRDLTPDKRLHGKAVIMIVVLINSNGEVECAKALSDSKLFAEPAARRAQNWKFKPMEVNGKALSVYGLLRSRIHYGFFSVVE